ncbi:MAG: hypothetical protein O9296_11220 [Novosphingobium sp.]|nr:hypothetical protein [Novosphingobium sp.]
MADVGASDIVAGGLITLIGWVGTFFLARKIHRFITGGSGKENKPRWFAANAAGIIFILTGMVWSPRIISMLSRYFSGIEGDPTEAIALSFGMIFFSSIGAAIGFGLGKLRMPAERK